jgi:hypothetical protein
VEIVRKARIRYHAGMFTMQTEAGRTMRQNPGTLSGDVSDSITFRPAKQKGGENELAKGSVVKRSGSWYAVYRDGDRQKWERAGCTKRSAEQVLAKRLDEIHSGTYQKESKIRFKEFAIFWLNDYVKVSVKISTYISYEMIIRRHLIPHFGNRWLHQISTKDVQNFVSVKITRDGLSPKSVVNILVPLKAMYKEGEPLDPDNLVKREFFPALDRAGLRRIRFHDFRHTYASLLIAQGESVKFIQEQLRHSSARTTLDRYGHLLPDAQKDAGERLDRTVFGDFVRKLLEKPAFEGTQPNNVASEVIQPQRLNLVAGGGFEPPTFGL